LRAVPWSPSMLACPGGREGWDSVIIGVPKETKAQENRVALTPAGCHALVSHGHQVLVERGAGEGSGFEDAMYRAAGARVVERQEVYALSDIVTKVKEPLPEEYESYRPGQVLYTYLHLAADRRLTEFLLERRIRAVAYETVQLADGSLPLLTPMSEVAGRMAPQVGARLLEQPEGGKGILLGGVPGVLPGRVVILGGGTVGQNAATIAVGMGADVTILDISAERLRFLDDRYAGRVHTLMSNAHNIGEAVARADLVIGAVLLPGARAPHLVTEEMVRSMERGSVIVDVAVDQGGVVETIDHTTTHAQPTYVRHGVVHYAVANMPGAVPHTSTLALTNVTLPYLLQLADKGFERAVRENPALAKGVNAVDGKLTYQAVAEAHGMSYTPLEEVLG
jgi:alanine dehydrogenase